MTEKPTYQELEQRVKALEKKRGQVFFCRSSTEQENT
jgi:hypothetical protein